MKRTFTLSATLAVLTGALVIASAIDASAREVRRSQTYTGARGGVVNRTVTREPGQRSVEKSVQAPNGRTWNRSATTTRNPDGSLTHESTAKTPTGGVFNRTCANGACTGSGTTGAGNSYTSSSIGTRNPDGTFTRQNAITTENGGVFNRTCTGASCTGSGTTAAGKEFTTSSQVTRNPDGTFTRETTITGPNGSATYNKTR